MLPAFRVKGLWPKPRGISKSDGTHPLTGALLPNFETTETILQLPLNKYDELVTGNPEYRLKYLDEDKDEITIGSEMELATRLEEPTSHSRLVQRFEDSRFYTSIPECMHGFHINDNEEARKLWTFFESSTISRNRAAHKMWTSPRLDPGNNVQALLDEHAYEFMSGYNFEGFNSHYNYLSEAGQQIKALAAKRDPSVQESALTASPAIPRITETPPQQTESLPSEAMKPSLDSVYVPLQGLDRNKISKDKSTIKALTDVEAAKANPSELPPWLTEIPGRAFERAANETTKSDCTSSGDKGFGKVQHAMEDDTFALAHAKVSESMASLNDELDKHLETAQALTRMLDQTTSPPSDSTDQKSLQNHLDEHFKLAQSATKMMNAVTKNRQSVLSTSSQAPTSESKVQKKESTATVSLPLPSNLSLGFAKYATQPNETRKALDKTDFKELDTGSQDGSPSISYPQEHLTDLGMKDSHEAGMKLRNQLYGIPKPRAGITEDDVHRWMLHSSNPPKLRIPKLAEQAAEPSPRQTSFDLTTSLNKKKSVRFSFPASTRGEWHLDGTFSPGSRTAEAPILLEKSVDESQQVQENTTAVDDLEFGPKTDISSSKDKLKSLISASLSEGDIVKIRELIKAFDEHTEESAVSIAQCYKDNLKAKGVALRQVQPPRASKKRSSEVTPRVTTRQTSEDAKVDSVETTITKLWCQAYEGIMSNIDTFTEQLNTHVKSQISREQATLTTLLAQQPPSGSFENDQTFLENARHVRDLISIQDSVEQMILRLRSWHVTSKDNLAPPGLCSEYKIDTERVQKTISGLGRLSSLTGTAFQDLFQTFLAVSNGSSVTASDSTPDDKDTLKAETAVPFLQWIPRRYALKIRPCDRIPELDKTRHKDSILEPAAAIADRKYHKDRRSRLEQARLNRECLGPQRSNDITSDPYAASHDFVMNRNDALYPSSIPGRLPLPPLSSLFVRDSVSHGSRPRHVTANSDNAGSWQAENSRQQASAPELTESGIEPSDVLLQNFPPLVPLREPQQNRHDLLKSMPSSSNKCDEPDSGPVHIPDPFFRRGHAYPSVKPHSVPPPHTQKESILSQQLSKLPGGLWDLHRTQNENTLTQQLNTLPEFQDQQKSTDRLGSLAIPPMPSALRSVTSEHTAIQPTQIQQQKTDGIAIQSFHSLGSLNETTGTPETYGTWSEDALLQTAKATTAQAPSSGNSSISDQAKPAPQVNLFQLYQDIPEHKDPRTAVKIMNCVEKLKAMGCESQVDGDDARLVVYAQAAGGSLETALDIMEEERQAYAEHKDHVDSYYD